MSYKHPNAANGLVNGCQLYGPISVMCLLCKQRLFICSLCRFQPKLCLYWVFLL